MNNFFRAIIAGYGAKKLGGGCFGTIIVFILIWVALGQCSFSSREVPPPQTYPSKHRVFVQVNPDRWTLNLNLAERERTKIIQIKVLAFERGLTESCCVI